MSGGGAKPGERRGGRKKGTPNQRTVFKAVADAQIRERAQARGIMPLEVMLENMRMAYEAGDMATAHEAAKDAAPYIHPKLSAVAATVDQRVTVDLEADAAAEYLIAELARRRRARRNGADPDNPRITGDQSETTH